MKKLLNPIFRSLKKNKVFTAINIVGLSIGISVFFILTLYFVYENSYDKFIANADNTYRIQLKLQKNNQTLFNKATSTYNIGSLVKENIPEVEDYARGAFNVCMVYHENTYLNSVELFWADSNFLDVVKLEMLQGNNKNALLEPYTTVLSEDLAKLFFGNTNPINKIIYVNEKLPFRITGIFKSLPQNSHLNFKLLLSLSTGNILAPGWGSNNKSWGGYEWIYNYVRLVPGADPKLVENKIAELVNKSTPDNLVAENLKFEFNLQKISEIHLNSKLENEFKANGSKQNAYIYLLIAILTLIIAWINYINLTIAKVYEKVKEAGIRKVLGVTRKHLIIGCITEAFIVNLLSTGLAIIIVTIFMPYFSSLSNSSLTLFLHNNTTYYLVFLIVLLVGTIVSGIYPGILMASFKPEKAIRSNYTNGKSGLAFRNILVVFQLAASIFIIITVGTIFKQMQYINNKDLGYKANMVLVYDAPRVLNDSPLKFEKYKLFKETVKKISSVKNVASTNFSMGTELIDSRILNRVNNNKIEDVNLKRNYIDEDYLDVLNIKLLAGSNLTSSDYRNQNRILINESACKLLGFNSPKNAVGSFVSNNGNYPAEIIGVMSDFHQESLKTPVRPMFCVNDHSQDFGSYLISITSHDIKNTITQINTAWDKTYVDAPKVYSFMDDQLQQLYLSELRFGTLLIIFACITVFLACLGLLGLVLIVTRKSIKAIGVRKVNGASIIEIIAFLNADYIKQVIIALLIAVPISAYFMTQWLNTFAYHTQLSWWIFALTGILILGITLLTVSWQSWKAATRNPVEALNYE